MTLLATIPSHDPPPAWALRERHLIDVMNKAAPAFVARYTRRDGTFVWREAWPGFDGSDDGYESYHNWPLFYALGGSSWIHETSRWLWEAVTKQFTSYGQIYREFDANYDWMHHGESSISTILAWQIPHVHATGPGRCALRVCTPASMTSQITGTPITA